MLYFIKEYFLPLYPTKYYYYKVLLPIFSNISEQNCIDKRVFNNVNRLKYSSPIRNTVTKNPKTFLNYSL